MVPDWKTNGKTRTQADSFHDAARGFFHTVKTERNMRIHLTAAVYVLFFSPFLGVTRSEYGVLLLTIAMVIAAEAFNTAIEMLCDYAQKSYNPLIGKTKDIAAGAVLAVLPQPVRAARASTSARIRANVFFIFVFSFLLKICGWHIRLTEPEHGDLRPPAGHSRLSVLRAMNIPAS